MKIDVTYEKADILRLVLEDLKKRQIKIKAGSMPEYKGALHVKLSIEAEDDEVASTPTTRSAAEAASRGDGEAPPREPRQEADDAVDMGDVLQQSQRVQATTKPSFQRQLGPNESLEFPREE